MSISFVLMILAVAFVTIVIHEYGHAAMARRKGMKIAEIVIGVPTTRLAFRSKRFRCPVRIGIFPVLGYVRTAQGYSGINPAFAALCLAGPQISLATAWIASGVQFLLFGTQSVAMAAVGGTLIALGALFIAQAEKTVPYVQYAALATIVGVSAWMIADAFGLVATLSRGSFAQEAMRNIVMFAYVTGVLNLVPFIRGSDGAQALRHGRGYASTKHLRFVTHFLIGAVVACVGASVYVTLS
jgi:hypothetical protein